MCRGQLATTRNSQETFLLKVRICGGHLAEEHNLQWMIALKKFKFAKNIWIGENWKQCSTILRTDSRLDKIENKDETGEKV